MSHRASAVLHDQLYNAFVKENNTS